MCANTIFLQRFQKITHLPVNIPSFYPESSVNNKIKGITAEDNKDAKFVLSFKDFRMYLMLNFMIYFFKFEFHRFLFEKF